MPLKCVYAKAPLVEKLTLPLCPGQARTQLETIENVYDLLIRELDAPAAWAPAFRLSCALTDDPAAQKPYRKILSAMENQREDGSLLLSVQDAVDAVCAAWAVYTFSPERTLLEKLLGWCRWANGAWDELMACDSVRQAPADLMAMLTGLYRVTGAEGLLKLCERLHHDEMDWSGALHTFAVAKPMKRIITAEELDRGMAEEKNAEARAESGLFTRQYLNCHGESLANGALACLEASVFSGNRQETTAAAEGWKRISRYHKAVCGGVTSDETVAGMNPSAGVDTAALGAWAEVFAAQLTGRDGLWAADELELMCHNGLKSCVTKDGVIAFQRVNSLKADCGTRDCYRVHGLAEQQRRAVIRLGRAWAAVLAVSVTARPDGAQVNLFTEGSYTLRLKQTLARLEIAPSAQGVTLSVRTEAPVRAALQVRLPGWMKQVKAAVNGTEQPVQGAMLVLDREWHDGDAVILTYEKIPELVESGYHQGVYVRYGADVMAAVPGEGWAAAAAGEPVLRDGRVILPAVPVVGWHSANGTPVDLPVCPRAAGAALELTMVPYAQTGCRLTVLPRSAKA